MILLVKWRFVSPRVWSVVQERIVCPRKLSLLILTLALLVLPNPVEGQEPPTQAQVDSLRIELAALQTQFDSLRVLIRRLQEQGVDTRSEEEAADDTLERLRAAAAAAAGSPDAADADQEAEFAGRQRSLQNLNPEISLTGDLIGLVDSEASGNNNFLAREFELSIQSALDPFSRAKVFLTREEEGADIAPFESEGGEEEEGGGTLEVEEGYVEWVSLPGGFGVKFGRYFHQFGQLNRWHRHGLPQQSRSLPHLAFIGEESLGQTGASVRWLLPSDGLGAIEGTVEVGQSSNEALFGESSGLSYLGHLNGFWQLGESVDLDLGLSGLFGDFEVEGLERDRKLFGVEASLQWAPPGQSRYRGLNIRGGLMINDLSGDGIEPAPEAAVGAWGMAELRLSETWLIGSRYDWVENPDDVSETAWLLAPTLTWWQSEWVRLRAELDHLNEMGDSRTLFLIQVTFAMGPHKHETY